MGDFVSPSAGRVSVADLAANYLEVRQGQISIRAWESDESAIRVHILRLRRATDGLCDRLQIE